MPRPLKVFLCHAHSDKDTVKALYARLKREGVDVWLDKEKLLPGADWEYEIRKAVRESDVVIVCLSKQFNQAGFRQKEVRIALEEADRKPEGEIFIIPARLEECDNLESLSRWHWVDLFESDGFQRLILALRIRADKIGATLRQRGAPHSRPRKDTEQQDAEKERIDLARREEEERERQRLAKEQADREAAEKDAREKLGREANEKIASEKAEREKAERETAARLVREKEEREAAQNAAHEKEEREKIEKARKAEQARSKKPLPVTGEKERLAPNVTLRNLGIGGILFACLLLAIFGGNYLVTNLNSTATEPPAQVTVAVTRTLTPAPTKTITPAPPTLTPTPELGIGSTQVSEMDGMVMVYVPAGEFMMGSNDGDTNEIPEHQVFLDSFWIDKFEVTNQMYSKCVGAGICKPQITTNWGYSYDYEEDNYNNYPIVKVNWGMAKTYCEWASRRLPTEAEWEKASRGTDGRTYPWGNPFYGSLLNFCDINCSSDFANSSFDDGYRYLAPVGNYPSGQSPYGVLDMAGNVWEWVSSLYEPYPYDATDGRENLHASGNRVIRGGGWSGWGLLAQSANRGMSDPNDFSFEYGFRCAMTP